LFVQVLNLPDACGKYFSGNFRGMLHCLFRLLIFAKVHLQNGIPFRSWKQRQTDNAYRVPVRLYFIKHLMHGHICGERVAVLQDKPRPPNPAFAKFNVELLEAVNRLEGA